MGKLTAIVLFVTLFITTVPAQVSHGGKPLFFAATKSYQIGMFEEMPSFDVEK